MDDQKYDIAWDEQAGKALKAIHKYLTTNVSKEFAQKIIQAIMEAVDTLETQPERYPPEPNLLHRAENFRFIIVKGYKIIYEFTGNAALILYIAHTKQHPDSWLDKIV